MFVAGVIVLSRSILWCAHGDVCGAGTCCSTLIRGCFCAFGPTRRTGRREGNKKDGRTQLPELDHSLSEDRWAQRLETVLKRGAILVPESIAAAEEKRQGHAGFEVACLARRPASVCAVQVGAALHVLQPASPLGAACGSRETRMLNASRLPAACVAAGQPTRRRLLVQRRTCAQCK